MSPVVAQDLINKAIETPDKDLKWLYTAWAMHYLTDAGIPYHSTLHPLEQIETHFDVEQYIDQNLAKYEPEIRKNVQVRDVKDVQSAIWEAANYSSQYADQLYNAFQKKDYATVDKIAILCLTNTVGYVAGTIKNLNTMIPKKVYYNSIYPFMFAAIVILIGVGVYKISERF